LLKNSMKKRTPQEWHNEFVGFYKQNYEHDLKNAIQHLGMLIANCNEAYYEHCGYGRFDEMVYTAITDTEYDDLCKKYVALNQVIGIEIELRSCSFLRVKDFVKK